MPATKSLSQPSARQRVVVARTRLLLFYPFFGQLALRLKLVEDERSVRGNPPTAYTDGRVLGFSPTFVSGLTLDELVGLVAHEVMHCAMGHPWRRGLRDAQRWNIACDYAINSILLEAGFKLPEGGLFESSFAGKSAEWIYARLPEQDQKQSGRGTDGEGWGEVCDAPASGEDGGDGEGEGEGGGGEGHVPTEADWQQAVQQAAQTAKARGSLPASLERFAKAAVAPRVDWRSVLRRFVQEVSRSDYSYRMPNRRFLVHGIYMPALYAEGMGPVLVAIDTSGSIDEVLLAQFNRELQAIAEEALPRCVYVVYCDAQVHRMDTFERGDQIVLHPMGGGGTDFRPVFEMLDDWQEEPPVCVVYLTDLEGSFPQVAPELPVLWATVKDHAVPFGEKVLVLE